ncbi:MAG: alpha/beta hydrolase [Mycobacterium sp.]|nr:alpha/beta hydrolase [Mycobacterium sp.]
MPATMMTVDGFPVALSVAGPDKSPLAGSPAGPHIVVLGAANHTPASYDSLCERLHIASMRTVVIAADPRLHPKAVLSVLDALDVPWGVVVGDRFGAELAWELAATRPERFTGLVVIDRGHPAVRDPHGVIRDPDCPPVEIDTTALVSGAATRAVVKASQRFVHSDFRLVEFSGRRNAAESTAQLAAEIVLRTSSW